MAKPNIKEVNIFPSTCESGHNFTQYNDTSEDGIKGFYKRDAREKADTSKVYAMLYCTKCAETKEITIINRRR